MIAKFKKYMKIWLPISLLIGLIPCLVISYVIFYLKPEIKFIDPDLFYLLLISGFIYFGALPSAIFHLLSRSFLKTLNNTTRGLLPLDKWIDIKQEFSIGLLGDDKKYLASQVEEHEISSYCRMIKERKPLTLSLIDKIFVGPYILSFFMYILYSFLRQLPMATIFLSIFFLFTSIMFLFRLFQQIVNLFHLTKKVDEMVERKKTT